MALFRRYKDAKQRRFPIGEFLRSQKRRRVSYRDYAPRVLEAKIKIDRFLSAPGNSAMEMRKAVEIAMSEYELASQAWGSQLSNSVSAFDSIGTRIAENADISKSPP